MNKKRDEKKIKKRKHARLHKQNDDWMGSLQARIERLEDFVREFPSAKGEKDE